MANSNGKITAPVTVTDVKQVLGVSSNDVGYLCSNQHGKINMWSKYKPVIDPRVSPSDDDWWLSYDKDAGWDMLYFEDISILTNISNYNWEYKKPIGGASSPYRLADFRGYDPNSEMPIKTNVSGNYTINYYSQRYLYISLTTRSQENNGDLDFNKIMVFSKYTMRQIPLSELYLAIRLTPTSGSYSYFLCSATKIGDESVDIRIDFQQLYNLNPNILYTTVQARLFLVSNKFTDYITSLPEDLSKFILCHDSFNLVQFGIYISGYAGYELRLLEISTSLQSGYTSLEAYDTPSKPYSLQSSYGECYIKLTIDTANVNVQVANIMYTINKFNAEQNEISFASRLWDSNFNSVIGSRVFNDSDTYYLSVNFGTTAENQTILGNFISSRVINVSPPVTFSITQPDWFISNH